MRILAALALFSACSSPKSPDGTVHPATMAPETSAPTTAAPESAAPETAAPATVASQAGPPVEPVKISAVLTPEQQARADQLVADILADQLNRLAMRKPENAFPFLYLAASHPRAEVVAEALDGMSRTWRRTGKGENSPLVDADFTAVVRARLTSAEPRVRAGAISAARLLIASDVPDEPVLAATLNLLKTGNTADRIAAAGLVMNVRDFQLAKPAKGDLQARIVEALLAALAAPETPVQAAVLDKLSRAAHPEIAQRDALKAAAEARLTHEDPGVRGTATLLLGRLARPAERDVVGRALLAALENPSPYVKAAAVEALARLEYRPALHGFIALLDLDTEATLTVSGFTALDGKPGEVELLLEGGQRMDAVVLNALRRLTGKSFDFKGGVTAQSREGLVGEAKAWYGKNQGKYPKP